jgi:hypothetical protein
VFKKWWPDLKEQFDRLDFTGGEPTVKRSDRELLEEVLSLVRQLIRGTPLSALPFWPNQTGYYNIDDAIKSLRDALGSSSLTPAQQLLFAKLGGLIREGGVLRDQERSTAHELTQPPPTDFPSGKGGPA